MNYFGGKINVETLDQKQKYTILFSFLVCYLVLVMCGTLGAPDSISSHLLECAESINECSLAETLSNQVQICQHANEAGLGGGGLKTTPTQLSVLLGLKSHTVEKFDKILMNSSVAVYESDSQQLFDYCTNEHITIETDHVSLETSFDLVYLARDAVQEID